MRKKNLYILLFLFANSYSFGQISGLYPDQFSAYFLSMAQLNPSYFPKNENSEAIIQSKVRSGVYNDIATFSGSFQKTIRSSEKQKHSFRILVSNEKEGPYISTPRLYANYGINIKIRKELNLMSGFSVGIVNPKYSTPTKSINTNLADGSFGVLLKYKATYFGMSANQMFNNSSKSFQEIKLNRFFNANFETTIPLSFSVDLKSYVLFIYYKDIPSQLNTTISACLAKKIEVGTGLKYTRGAYFFTSIIIDESGKHPLKIAALYNSSFLSKASILGQSVELNLTYSY